MPERIIREDADGVCTLTLNRPDKLNALDTASFDALDALLQALEQDDGIGCVILRGAGKAFCAGADLKEIDGSQDRPPRFKSGVIERLSLLAKPVIVAVHGVCFTGGLELALGRLLGHVPAPAAPDRPARGKTDDDDGANRRNGRSKGARADRSPGR
jgi:enoyl-CoA hydratase/carnithine racemase